jgi:uroporphyrinogen-III decarboxylase
MIRMNSMTSRERYVNTLLFRKTDRVPLDPGKGRESTHRNWHAQGLPVGVDSDQDILLCAYREAGGKEELPEEGEGFPMVWQMIPQFEETILERGERTQIVQDWKGNICEISNDFDPRYLRDPIDFVTRRWIKCPVESRADWIDMMMRYDPRDPSRLPVDAPALARRLQKRTWPLRISVSGPFWQLREWLGFENLCVLFHDDPGFLKDMTTFWEQYVAQLLRTLFALVIPDEIHLAEDMAFKGFSMISPAMTREFFLPVYSHWGKIIREAGCPIYAMDSDGFIDELIPIWAEGGILACDPVEVAAHNDIVDLRRRFGRKMAFLGGIDKRAIAKGGSVIEAEIVRIAPVIGAGGYIPGCDHGVPADVSWPNYVRFVQLLARETGWM